METNKKLKLDKFTASQIYRRDIHKMIRRVERGASGVETHSKPFFLLSVEDLSVSL